MRHQVQLYDSTPNRGLETGENIKYSNALPEMDAFPEWLKVTLKSEERCPEELGLPNTGGHYVLGYCDCLRQTGHNDSSVTEILDVLRSWKMFSDVFVGLSGLAEVFKLLVRRRR